MQDLQKQATLLLTILMLICGSMAYGQTVSVGSGSYTTTFPGTDEAGRNTYPTGLPGLSGTAATKPVPTNDWWSDLMKTDHGGKAFNYPLSFKSKSEGLVVNYTIPLAATANDYREPISAVDAIVVGTDGLAAASSTASDHSDWGVTMNWANTFYATMNHGSPFVYFEKNGGGSAKVAVNFNSGGVSISGNKLIIQGNMNNSNFVVFGPTGSTWTGSGGTYTNTLNGNNYWSMAMLPFGMDVNSAIAALEPYAYVFPANTEVSWNYNENNGIVRTTFTVTPDIKEGINNVVMQGLLPHQWDRLAGDSPQPGTYSYPSVRGTIKMLASNQFIVENKYSGILPTLPDLAKYSDGFDLGALSAKVDQIKNDGLPAWTDSYNEGQNMNRLVQAARIADQLGDSDSRDALLNTVQERLEDWLSVDGGEVAFLFYYNADWDAMIGYPAGHRQDENLNDHHFHWGYFIHAAAALEQFRPGWAAQWGGMIDLLIRDAANPSRTDNMFPFLRNFSPYAGHSWANGFATEPFGNDQESTSESMQFNCSLIHWGTITGNTEIRDLGIYLYTTETSTVQEYWFDVEERSFQPAYDYEMVARIWGGGYDNGTWWTTDVAASYGIQLYPIHGGSLYLGHRQDYVQRVWTEMTQNTDVLNNIPNDNLWYDTYWKFLSFLDPQQAVNLYEGYTERAMKVGISDAQTYHWLYGMNAMGQVRPDISANYPIAAAFGSGGNMTYVAHNYGSSPITVSFSDGFNLSVPANSMATNRDLNVDVNLTTSASEVNIGGSVNLNATVSGTVDRVEFYSNGQLIGSDFSAPYEINSGSLSAGFPRFFAKAVAGSSLSTSNVVSVQVGQQVAYNGTPTTLPGTIEAGHYDAFEGGNGQGISYSDNTAWNEGDFRTSEAVDAVVDVAEGATVGWVDPGEWLEYTVNVGQAGLYDVTLRYASGNTDGGGPIWFEQSGTKISGDITVPFTGTDWNVWQDVVAQDVSLSAGEQVIRLQVGNGGLNLGRMTFAFDGQLEDPVLTSITLSPGTSSTTPGGTIQYSAQGFDQYGDPFPTTFSWNSSCGSVSSSGLFTAPATEGSCTLTVSSGSVSANRTISVTDQSNGIGDVLWEENFDTFNADIWTPNEGDGCPNLCGWGNAELEYYSSNNVYIEPVPGESNNNALVLEARNEAAGSSSFTSGKVDTDGKVSIHYGLIEVRMRVPNLSTGLWPAAWLLGDVNLPWPAKGEIDMMEMGHAAAERERQGHIGVSENNYVGANAIWQAADGTYASIAWDENYNQPYNAAQALNDRFVTYRLYWEPTSMRFTVIDQGTEHDLYADVFPIDENGDTQAFTKPYYMLLNLAVGGNFTDAAAPGDVTAPLPAKMYVDYVRVSEWNGHGSVEFSDGSIEPETGVFGVYTEDTPVNNQLNFGTDAEIYAWGETVQEGTEAPYEGTEVIAWETVTANSWFGGGIASLYGRNMASFVDNGSLKFKIKIPGDVAFRVGITDNYTNEAYVSFPAGVTTYGLVRDGNWGQVEIPLADLSGLVAFQDLNYMFAIVSQDGALPTSTFQMAIDDIVWDDGNDSTPMLTSITVSPSDVNIDEGGSQAFSAQGYDQNGNPMAATFAWSASAGSIDNNGNYTGTVVGSHVVTATSGAVSGTANITVDAVGGLPSPWQTADIGAVAAAGSASYTSGTFTLEGSGADIWGSEDEFRFVYQEISDDVTITARLSSLTNTDPWAKAGVMIRASLTGNSAHAMTVVTSGNGAAFQRRLANGGSSSHTGTAGSTPYWVRLERSGSNFTSYVSSDGSAWTQVGTASIAINSTVFVGLIVTSHNDGTLCTAPFDNVNVETTSNVPVTGISVSPTNAVLTVGESQQLVATITPSNASNQNVVWSSSNPSVATVNATGLVNASQPGTATITVTTADGGFTAMSTIQVASAQTDITDLGGIISAEYSDSPAGEEIDKLIDNNSATKFLTFNAAAWVQYHAPSAYVVDSYTLTSANDAPGRDPLNWTLQGSNNGSVWTTIDSRTGEDFPARFETRSFSFSNNDPYVYYRLNLQNNSGSLLQLAEIELFGSESSYVPVTGVSISPTAITLTEGSAQQLTASVSPTDATDQSVSWSSGNPSIATVDGNGNVTAVSSGSTTITVTTNDGGYVATANITVNAQLVLSSIVVNPFSATIDEGQTQQFNAQGYDQFGDPYSTSFSWSTTGGSIDGSGLYTGTSSGNYTVTASSGSVNGSASITVNSVATGWAIPGRIEAENFNGGGEGIGYHDLTAGNTGGAFRTSEDVDIEVTGDSNGGSYNVGWIDAGEWLAFDITVSGTSNLFDFDFRLASPSGSGALHMEIDGVDVTGQVTLPQATGGWQSYTTVTASGINISSGNHLMRIVFDQAGINLNYVEGFAVSSPVLTSILVSPGNATIDEGQSQQFTAQGYDQNGNPMSASLNWSASQGSIDSNGLYSGTTSGNHVVTASSGAVSGSADVTVNAVVTNCTGGPANSDYTYTVSGGQSPQVTFEPGYAGVGDGIVILYYGTSPTGGYPGYTVSPNTPFVMNNVSAGQTIYFYYTYSVPEGGERNSSNDRHNFVVGNCGAGARISTAQQLSTTVDAMINVYPNPAQNVLNVTSSHKIQSLTVFGIDGRQYMRLNQFSTGDKYVLDIESLKSGNYILRVDYGTGVGNIRFSKQ